MTVPLSLLLVHFIADFMLQTDWMAQNKSKRWDALALHVSVYSLPFLLWSWQFAAITFLLHFVTDAVTSRINGRFWFFKREDGIWQQADYTMPKHGRTLVNPFTPVEGSNRHWFFVGIGADQLIHAACLAWTLQLVG